MTLVSVMLPTYNRRSFLPTAIEHFRAQDHPNRELIIVDDGSDRVGDLVPSDDSIRYIRLDPRRTIGAKRNLACAEARGDFIIHWDDDDWAAPWRMRYQVEQLSASSVSVCGLDRLFYYEPSAGRAWEYQYSSSAKPWVAGNTLCYRKSFWLAHPFPDIDLAEDARFVWQAQSHEVLRLNDSRFIVAFIHDSNISPKATSGCYWKSAPVEIVRALMNAPAESGSEPEPVAAMPPPQHQRLRHEERTQARSRIPRVRRVSG